MNTAGANRRRLVKGKRIPMTTSIVTYNDPESNISLDLPLDIDAKTTWVNQRQLSDLLDLDTSVISRHITNYKKERGERAKQDIANFAITADDGKTYNVEHYSVTVAVYVGFRAQATKRVLAFQDWVGKIIEERLQSNKTLTPTQALLATVQRMVDIEAEQAQQAERLHRIEARQDAADHKGAYFTVFAYAHYINVSISEQAAQRIGKSCASLSRHEKRMIERVKDVKRGYVNSYHENILARVFNAYTHQEPLPDMGEW